MARPPRALWECIDPLQVDKWSEGILSGRVYLMYTRGKDDVDIGQSELREIVLT